jgi:PAS domain S-box-containing protein
MSTALLAIAHDALLAHAERGDARLALRMLVAALSQALGCSCQLQLVADDGSGRWREGGDWAEPDTCLPVLRLGRPLGLLRLRGHAAADVNATLQPVWPALQALLQHAQQAAEASQGQALSLPNTPSSHADLIRAALTGADAFVWEWTLHNDWLTDIDEGLSLLGYTSAQVGHTQEAWNSLIHPDDLQANHEAYLRHERGETFVYEHSYRVRAADGGWRWMLERGRIVERDADGRPLRMVGTQSDITQRRLAELAVQSANDRLASIARSVPQVLFQSRDTPEGLREFLYISENSQDVLGLEPEALLRDASLLQSLVLLEDREGLPAGELPVQGQSLMTEYRIRRPDGQQRWLRVISTAQLQPDGVRLWHGSMEDVTERRELERSRELAAQAQAASLAKTQFLARMSHELRTPLNAVLGFAQLMEIDQAEPPQPGQQRRLKLVREAGEHLLHMINDMLDLTRIESGGMALLDEAVPLRELATRMLELVRGLADKAQLQLVLLPGAEVTVRADRTRTRQVLLNLLTNAIKYNRPGGRVVVEVVSTATGQGSVVVHDTGQGIAEADLPRIFDPFHRGAQAAGSVDGAGIGLAVTRALVQLMGGEVRAASTSGVGSTFSVYLPLREAPVSPTAQSDT